MIFRKIETKDDPTVADLVRSNLKAYGLDLPGTVYYDDNLNHLSSYYLDDKKKRTYYVAEDNGVGYTLISLIENKARDMGYKKLYLETHTNLEAAIHIYEKCGYEEIDKPAGVVHATMNRFYIKELV